MSRLEETLALQMRAVGLPTPKREYRFHPDRRWRFDFAWPDRLVAAEVEGGTYSGGRHTRGVGFERDAEKYNEAGVRGWRVFRFTTKTVKDGSAVSLLEREFGAKDFTEAK